VSNNVAVARQRAICRRLASRARRPNGFFQLNVQHVGCSLADVFYGICFGIVPDGLAGPGLSL